jgi:hypothetical protein
MLPLDSESENRECGGGNVELGRWLDAAACC